MIDYLISDKKDKFEFLFYFLKDFYEFIFEFIFMKIIKNVFIFTR